MASPAEHLADLVPNTIIDGTTGWPSKIGKLTSAPDRVAVFYDTGGQNPNPKWQIDYLMVQCIVRSGPNDYSTGWAKIREIRDALLGHTPVTLGSGDRIDGITMMGDVTFINYDDKERPTFSCNFKVFYEPAPNVALPREPL